MDDENYAKLTKQDFRDAILFMKYRVPALEHARYMREMYMFNQTTINDLKKCSFWSEEK